MESYETENALGSLVMEGEWHRLWEQEEVQRA